MFEKIISIKKTKIEKTFDIEMLNRVLHNAKADTKSNFVANSIICKNSGGDARADDCLEDTFTEFEQAKEFYAKYPIACDIAIGLEAHIRHRGVHAAGVVLTENPIAKYVPVERISGDYAIAWEKKETENMGLIKFDILGLKTLGVISNALKMIEERTGKKIKLPTSYEDSLVYKKVFENGNTMGTFQTETSGMSKLSKQLKINNFKLLYDTTALYRPGSLRSGQTADYVLRHNKKKEWKYDHPLLEPITKNTYGLILYQEQVMKVMFELGKFSWATAESARKIMTKSQGKDAFNKMRVEFCANAKKEHGLSLKESGKIFDVVSTFGCLTGETEIYRSSANQYAGTKLTIKEAFKYQKSDNFKHRGLNILAMSADGFVRPHPIKAIYNTGKKKVFYIKTDSNKSIKASASHRFLVDGKWKQVKDTKEGDWIQVSDLKLAKKIYGDGRGSGPHGEKSPVLRKGCGTTIEFKNAKNQLLTKWNGYCQICGSDEWVEMHHIDENHNNNNFGNLMLLCRKHHREAHGPETFRRFRKGYPTHRERISVIKSIGERDTFDIEMDEAPRNFIANNFVSHNSYGFNLSHSVEYSIITYWTAWLKTYYPAEFFASLMSKEGDSTKIADYIREAKNFADLKVLTPDINDSKIGFQFKGKDIISGFDNIKGFAIKSSQKIIDSQPYKDLEDFVEKCKPTSAVFKALACVGALDGFYSNRKTLFNSADNIIKKNFARPLFETEWNKKETELKLIEFLDLPSETPLIDMFENPFADKIKFEEIGKLDFDEAVNERWVKGIVTFINFKQEGLEGQWTMFDNVLERRYAHLNVNDGTGNVLIHLAPEQYTYYKKYLEKGTGFPVIVRGHSIKDFNKIYCDAMIVLNDIDYKNPIINYINGKTEKNIEKAKLENPSFKVGMIESVTYKVSKKKNAYARLQISGEENKYLMCFKLTSDIFITGEILVYSLEDPFVNIFERIK